MPVSVGYTTSTISSLKLIDTSDLVAGYSKLVISKKSWYIYDPSSLDNPDDDLIVAPQTNNGRWYKSLAKNSELDNTLNSRIFIKESAYTVSQSSIYTYLSYTAPIGTYSLFTDGTTSTGTGTSNIETNPWIKIDLGEIKYVVSHVLGGGALYDSSNVLQFNVGFYLNLSNLEYSIDGITWYSYGAISGMSNTQETYKEFGVGLIPSRYWRVINYQSNPGSRYIAVTEWKVKCVSISSEATNTIKIISNSLTPNAGGMYSFSALDSFSAIKLETNYPARIRIYLTSTYASNDFSRTVSEDPAGEHGCLLECVTSSSNLSLDLAPVIDLYSIENGSYLYAIIENKDTINRIIICNLTVIVKSFYENKEDQTLLNLLLN